MIYKDMTALCAALDQIDMTDASQTEPLRHLFRVYMDATKNPPDGVIGVGVITYAQSKLMAAQGVTS